jgi:heme oxygenase
MHPASSMLNRLDMETRDFHVDTDAYWLDLMASGVSREQYQGHLTRVYGFESSVESALAYTPHLIIADRRDHARSGLIVQDLMALGMSPQRAAALPQCRGIGPFQGPEEALGWKYVSERPTQLFSAIKRNVVARVPEIANAVTYLSSFDGIAAPRWQQFGLLLDDVARRSDATEKIVEAAKAAFVVLTQWFRETKYEQAVHP